ncbi:hypothetical protein EGW08_006986, partial [Elysia chlorotica]
AWDPDGTFDTQPTDLNLVVEKHTFSVHKEILMYCSHYFQGMFSSGMLENNKNSVTLQLVAAEPFKIILHGFYSGRLDLDETNIFEITETAHVLQVTSELFSQCTSFLERMINTQSCFVVMFFCDSVNLADLYTKARKFCLGRFSQLRHLDSFLELTQPQMKDYLADKFLLVDEEIHVFEAMKNWVTKNKARSLDISLDYVRELVAASICLKNSSKDLDTVANMIFDETRHFKQEELLEVLGNRERQEEVYMFWSLLKTTDADGCVDVVRLEPDGHGVKVGTMTDVVLFPTYDFGSAFCRLNCCVYLAGGGPNFGKMNWIKQLYKFDLSKVAPLWEPICDLNEIRRHHAMVGVGTKLYIFGGFGKFRIKNYRLDCFDLETGVWEEFQNMPAHEVRPVATVDERSIFYMDQSHTLHCFDTTCNEWSSLPVPVPAGSPRPVGIHALNQEPGSLVAVLDGDSSFTILNLKVDRDSVEKKCTLQGTWEVVTDRKFAGSAVVNDKLILFVGLNDVDCVFPIYEPIRRIITCCIKTQTVVKTTETNVVKALNIVTAPHIPSSFHTGSCRLESS